MAIKASRADAGNRRAAILGRIELLLREGRQQQAQPFQLPGRKQAVEQSEVIGERDQLTLRDIAQIGARRQVDGWRKLSQEVIRQIEIDVEPGQVSPVLLLDRIDQEVRKNKAAVGVFGMRQGVEPLRIEILFANLVRAHRRKLLPGHSGGQFDADAFLHGFSAIHRDPLGRAVAQIVALVEQSVMLLFNPWFCRRHSRHHRREWFGTVYLHIARLPALFLLGISEVQEQEQTRNYQKHPNLFDQNVWLRHIPPPEIWESNLDLGILRLAVALRNRRIGNRRNAADSLGTGRKRRSRNKELITLCLSRTTAHASPRKGIPVGVRSRETIRECLQEGHDLVLLLIRQAKITRGHVEIVLDLVHGPAVYFFGLSCRAVSGRDGELELVARIVEVDELFQALDVPVVKEPLLEVRPRRLGGRTLWGRHSHIAHGRHLKLAVDSWCKFSPSYIRVGAGTEAASEESSHSQISVAEAIGIPDEPEGIRPVLIIESIPGIQG